MSDSTRSRRGILRWVLSTGAWAILAAAGCSGCGEKPGGAVLPAAKDWGEFLGDPQVELLPDGRNLKLKEDFVYIDPRKKVWTAPKDSVVDGASIPQAFWTLVGGPLEGPYRNASVVHDTECVRKGEPWQGVHLMFYEGCRCGGVSETKAKVMYWAVYHFGPRWELVRETRTVEETRPDGTKRTRAVTVSKAALTKPTAKVDDESAKRAELFIQENNPSLEELRKLDPSALPRR
jgi:hypothetical protein